MDRYYQFVSDKIRMGINILNIQLWLYEYRYR